MARLQHDYLRRSRSGAPGVRAIRRWRSSSSPATTRRSSPVRRSSSTGESWAAATGTTRATHRRSPKVRRWSTVDRMQSTRHPRHRRSAASAGARGKVMRRPLVVLGVLALIAAACSSGTDTPPSDASSAASRAAPRSPGPSPSSGTRTTSCREVLDPFVAAYPDLDIQDGGLRQQRRGRHEAPERVPGRRDQRLHGGDRPHGGSRPAAADRHSRGSRPGTRCSPRSGTSRVWCRTARCT